jgi:hypothetical protein
MHKFVTFFSTIFLWGAYEIIGGLSSENEELKSRVMNCESNIISLQETLYGITNRPYYTPTNTPAKTPSTNSLENVVWEAD